VAESLARAGVDVTVLDMRSPGRGASHASAGMLTPYIEAEGHAPALDLALRSLWLFDAFVSDLKEIAPRVEYARTGTLQIALDEDDAARLIEHGQALAESGVDVQWLDEHSLRAFEPSVTPAALGGLFTAGHGFVGVATLLAALIERAKRRGATFEWPVEVSGIETTAEGVSINCGVRTFAADAAVLAGGSWSRRVRIAGVPALPVRPVKGQLLHLHWCEGDQPRRVVWGPNCYAVPWADGSLLVGATTEDVGFDESATVSGVHGLTAAAVELLPHASGARFEVVRVGLRPALPDDLPAIGPFAAAPRVVAATGHFRSGVLLAPVTAEMVTRYLIEGVEDPAFAFTTPNRLAPVPSAKS
jgi:glycine oxidase